MSTYKEAPEEKVQTPLTTSTSSISSISSHQSITIQLANLLSNIQQTSNNFLISEQQRIQELESKCHQLTLLVKSNYSSLSSIDANYYLASAKFYLPINSTSSSSSSSPSSSSSSSSSTSSSSPSSILNDCYNLYDACLKLDSTRVDIMNKIAEIQWKKGEGDKAKLTLLNALNIQKNNKETLQLLSMIVKNMGQGTEKQANILESIKVRKI